MQIYANSDAIEQASKTLPDLNLRLLFTERLHQLNSGEYEIHEIVHFNLVECESGLII